MCRGHFDILAVDDELYFVDITTTNKAVHLRIERYYPEENKWQEITKVIVKSANDSRNLSNVVIGMFCQPAIICSMRIFKGFSSMRQMETEATITQRSLTSQKGGQKCLIM